MSGIVDALYPKLPVIAQNLACTWAGYRRDRQRFSSHFHRILDEWEVTVRGPVESLVEIQRERLDRLVDRARQHVPHYRALPPPSTAKDPSRALAETLANIPVLEKDVYRDHHTDFIATDLPRHKLIPGKTSGTTGTALPLWYTTDALAEEFATFWRQRRNAGVALGDANLTFNGQIIVPFGQRRPPFWRTNYWGHQTLFSLYHASPDNMHDYVDAIHAAPGSFVQGYPSMIHLAARALLNAGRPVPRGRFAGVFTSSESLLPLQRDGIEAAFGAPVRDRYGVSEFAVSMTECADRALHVDMEFCVVEVEVEEETDDYVRGPLLVTGLGNDATPFLRYRVGDIGTRSKHPCPCGRPGDVFLDVDGRIEDYVVTPDGRRIGRLDHIFKDQLDIAEAQILQDESGRLRVLVVRRDNYTQTSERELLKQFRTRVGDEIAIEIAYCDSIDREPNGKFRAVKSAIGADTGASGG
jgi:phenylacetate-CoA ligase